MVQKYDFYTFQTTFRNKNTITNGKPKHFYHAGYWNSIVFTRPLWLPIVKMTILISIRHLDSLEYPYRKPLLFFSCIFISRQPIV